MWFVYIIRGYIPAISLFLLCTGTIDAQVVLNAYAKVTAITGNSVLAVSNVNQAGHTFTVGGQVIVMQMQENAIGTNTVNNPSFGNLGAIGNAGVYQIASIGALQPATGTPTSITLTSILSPSFSINANASVQVITYRDLGTVYTTTANITGLAWDGNVGGVIALRSSTRLNLNHSITANGIGFRGGAASQDFYDGLITCPGGPYTSSLTTSNGYKGEGIYKATNTNFTAGRGKVLTGGGGGGMINSGGGGGGNFSAGGNGGLGWSCTASTTSGGLGGIALNTFVSAGRLFMGGGGGGGQQDDGTGIKGANGGGIIFVSTPLLVFACPAPGISAQGEALTSAFSSPTGQGGGGAGGSVVMGVTTYSAAGTCTLSVSANGSNGVVSNGVSTHGGGGGGGEGVLVFSTTVPPNVNATAGPGAGGADCYFCSTGGAAGGTLTGNIITSQNPLPVSLTRFEGICLDGEVKLQWSTASEHNSHYFVLERSHNAIDWEQAAQVPAAGSSQQTLHYHVSDEPKRGQNLHYYRLRQIDLDQTNILYGTISVMCEPDAGLRIFPVPARAELEIETGSDLREMTLGLYTLSGQLLQSAVRYSEDGFRASLDVSSLAPGIYVVMCVDANDKPSHYKIVIY